MSFTAHSITSLLFRPRPVAFGAIALAGALSFPAAFANAQDTQIQITTGDGQQVPAELATQLNDMFNKFAKRMQASFTAHTPRLSPGLVTADPAKGTAAFELTNRSEDTLTIALTASVEPRLPIENPDLSKLPPDVAAKVENLMNGKGKPGDTTAVKKAGNPLLDDDSTAASEAGAGQPKEEAIDVKKSLAPWITGLPKQVTLLPHEKKTISVRVVPPAQTAAGKYSAWIVASTQIDKIKAPDLASDLAAGLGGANIKMSAEDNNIPIVKNQLQSSAKLEIVVGQ